MEITSILHSEHPLRLWDKDANLTKCYACHRKQWEPENPFYYCETCEQQGKDRHPHDHLFFHKSCAELPQKIQISLHPNHPLTFVQVGYYNYGACDYCLIGSSRERDPDSKSGYNFLFRCDQCPFKIDFGCASMLMKDDQGRQGTEHFSHRHPLLQLERWNKDETCGACKTELYGLIYGCLPCDFYLHKSCLDELKEEIKHPFHATHCLKIKEGDKSCGSHNCGACGSKLEYHINYECCDDKCDFKLHIGCANLMPNFKYKGHQHDLVIIENHFEQNQCKACTYDIGENYCIRCVDCDISYHVHCRETSLPRVIKYENHTHPLTFAKESSPSLGKHDYCDVCKEKRNSTHPFYYCAECQLYFAHMHCVITESQLQLDERQTQRHFSHQHYLISYENNEKDTDVFCTACEEPIHNTTTAYHCNRCKFYLHELCMKLPEKILYHPFRQWTGPQPVPLTIPTPFIEKERFCSACNKSYSGFAYCETAWGFNLDLDCILLKPHIKIDEHDHKLTFFKKLYGELKCTACESSSSDFFYLLCVYCGYNIHLLCTPLVEFIYHGSHPDHPLVVKDNLAEDGSDEYCDYCEDKIENRQLVYCCEDCHYMLHFECVIIEVLNAIEEGDKKLRPIKKLEVLTIPDLYELITMEDERQLTEIVIKVKEELHQIDEQSDDISNEYYDLNENFLSFVRNFSLEIHDWSGFVSSYQFTEDVLQLVQVGEYLITEDLEEILKNMLRNYGDFGANCNYSKPVKMSILFGFCLSIRTVQRTGSKYIDEDLLYNLWIWCKVAKAAGFEVQFAFDNWKNIIHSRLGLATEMSKYENIVQLHEEKFELHVEIAEQMMKMKKIERDIRKAIEHTTHDRTKVEKEQLHNALEKAEKGVGMGLWDYLSKNALQTG